MSTPSGVSTAQKPRPTLASRLKIPAILLLIVVNVLYFGGNAALDLWQAAGPAVPFSGVVTAHDVHKTTGENSTQQLVVTVNTGSEQLNFDVPQHTFDDTQLGQRVSGELDAHGLLGHDEALRSLTADGKRVFESRPTGRVVNQIIVLVVILAAGGIAIRWIVAARHRAAAGASGSV